MIRWKNVLRTSLGFYLSRKYPSKVKERLINLVREELGENFDVEKHFTPRYNPWDQRMCLVPDSDLFNAINDEHSLNKSIKYEVPSSSLIRASVISLRL